MYISFFISALWAVFAVIGFVVYGVYDRGDGTFYDLRVEDDFFVSSMIAHVFAAVFLPFGAVFFKRISDSSVKNPLQLLREDSMNTSDSIVLIATIFSTVVCLISNIGAYGIDGLIYRTYYIPDADGYVIVAQLTGVLATLLASILACRQSPPLRLISLVCFVIAFLLIFAKGSRYAVVALLIYYSLPYLVSGNNKSKPFSAVFKTIFVCFIAYFLMHASLYFRSDSQYGLAPYFFKLGEAFDSLSDDEYKSVWDSFLNVTFSLPVTEVTISSAIHEWSHIYIAISPFSGDFAGWYDIAPSRRISEEIPYSALGELYGYSPLALIFYMFSVGAVFSMVEHELNWSNKRVRGFLVLFTFGFCLLFALFTLQYNLRSATRMIYYLLAVLFFNRIFSKIFFR